MSGQMNFLFLGLWAFLGLFGLSLAVPLQSGNSSIGFGVPSNTTLISFPPVAAVNVPQSRDPALTFTCLAVTYRRHGTIDCFGTYETLPMTYKRAGEWDFDDCWELGNIRCFDRNLADSPLWHLADLDFRHRVELGVVCSFIMVYDGMEPKGHACYGTEDVNGLFRYHKLSWKEWTLCVTNGDSCPLWELEGKEVTLKETWSPSSGDWIPSFGDPPASTLTVTKYFPTQNCPPPDPSTVTRVIRTGQVTSLVPLTTTTSTLTLPAKTIYETKYVVGDQPGHHRAQILAAAPVTVTKTVTPGQGSFLPPTPAPATTSATPTPTVEFEHYTREFSCQSENNDQLASMMWQADTQAIFCTERRSPLIESYHMDINPKVAPNNGWGQKCRTTEGAMASGEWMLQMARQACENGGLNGKWSMTLTANPVSVTH